MRLEVVPITKLKSRKKFFKGVSNLEELKANIKKRGLQNPVIVDTKYQIIDGQARYDAMEEMSYETITIIVKEESDFDSSMQR